MDMSALCEIWNVIESHTVPIPQSICDRSRLAYWKSKFNLVDLHLSIQDILAAQSLMYSPTSQS